MAGLFYLVLALVALVLAAYVFVSTPAARIVRMGHTITVVALAATALVLFLAGRAGLAMMLATAALGLLLYLASRQVRAGVAGVLSAVGWGPDRGFDQVVAGLVAFSAALGDLVGQVFALFVLTVAAAEAAIGLAILVVFFRNRGSIAVEDVNMMKG